MEKANQVLEECASTNDHARTLAEAGFPQGTWISSRKQGQGRGRLGRKWESLEGNLFLSMIARISDKSRWTWVSLLTAVAAQSALKVKFPKLEVKIKWPNDLCVIQGEQTIAKLGGILCEASTQGERSFIVIGLGLNCRFAPEGLDQLTTSLSLELGREISADQVREEIVSALQTRLAELESKGPAEIRQDYLQAALLAKGSAIEWTKSTGEKNAGFVQGLGESGELIVLQANGKIVSLLAEDVKIRAGSKAGGGFLL